MLQPLSVPIQESISELRVLQKQHPNKYKALQMLVLLKEHDDLSKDKLSLLSSETFSKVEKNPL